MNLPLFDQCFSFLPHRQSAHRVSPWGRTIEVFYSRLTSRKEGITLLAWSCFVGEFEAEAKEAKMGKGAGQILLLFFQRKSTVPAPWANSMATAS